MSTFTPLSRKRRENADLGRVDGARLYLSCFAPYSRWRRSFSELTSLRGSRVTGNATRAPGWTAFIPGDARTVMMVVGAIEIVAGIVVAIRRDTVGCSSFGSWASSHARRRLSRHQHFGLLVGALALSSLAFSHTTRGTPWRSRTAPGDARTPTRVTSREWGFSCRRFRYGRRAGQVILLRVS